MQYESKNILIVSLLCSLVLLCTICSFAYLIVMGVHNNTELSIDTGNLSLVFSDGLTSFQGSLESGEKATKFFSIENTGSLEVTVRIMWNDLINTFTDGSLIYSLAYSEVEEGPYTEIVVDNQDVPISTRKVKKILGGNLVIPAGKKFYYQLTIKFINLETTDQTLDINALLSTNFTIEESDGHDVLISNAASKMLKKLDVVPREESPNLSDISPPTNGEDDSGVYSNDDDYGTSYYYRGDVKNNYVKFTDKYWRIVRINGNGSIRIIYDGNQAFENGVKSDKRVAIQKIPFNNNANDAKYVGYMYGSAFPSTSKQEAQQNEISSHIKGVLETWYVENILNKDLDKYISDEIFCNDRSTAVVPHLWHPGDSALGYGAKNFTYYGLYQRTYDKEGDWLETPNPSLKCTQINDRFTVNNRIGNKNLEYPIGLITADEVMLAGGGIPASWDSENQKYYLYKGIHYWQMTPYMVSANGYASALIVSEYGFLTTLSGSVNGKYCMGVDCCLGIAPVINLTSEYFETLIGDGTISNPFREIDVEP